MIGRLAGAPSFLLKYLAGVLLCQLPPGGLLVIGWSYRFMRGEAFRLWWREGVRRGGKEEFESFLARREERRGFGRRPNWLLHPEPGRILRGEGAQAGWRRFPAALGFSLWENLRLGAQGLLNSWLATAPGCILWLFSWYAGWNNSFHKGYEQAWVGPATGIFGVLLFIAAMFYVPLAQARQAVNGDWRAFYHFRAIWTVVRTRCFACAALAGLYSLVSLPVAVLKVLPIFATHRIPEASSWSDAQALGYLEGYFFRAGLVFFPAFILLKAAAARIYAGGLLRALRTGALAAGELGAIERRALDDLGLAVQDRDASRPFLLKALGWAGTRAARVLAAALSVALWFSFVAQIFAAEFFNYHPRIGWLNQPLVHLPYFQFVPESLRRAVREQRGPKDPLK